MTRTKIEWVRNDDGSRGYSWNPVTGCYHGCPYCYARRHAHRFARRLPGDERLAQLAGHGWRVHIGRPGDTYPAGFAPTYWPHRLSDPYRWRSPSTCFVCSMGDLLGDWVPVDWIDQVRAVMSVEKRHRYLLLTKNPRRYAQFVWPTNCWLGTTCENQEAADLRVRLLHNAPTPNRFLSLEPLLGPIDLSRKLHKGNECYRTDIGWVIVGAQTGPGASLPDPAWVDSIIDQCRAAKVPVFCKHNLGRPDLPQEVPW